MPLIRRWRVHKCAKSNTAISASIRKHGAESFKIEAIYSAFSESDLDVMEVFFIDYFDCLAPKGYNILRGGNASQCRGQAAWNKGRKATPEMLITLSVSHMGQAAWNKGLKASDVTKAKQSAAKKGKRINPATEFKAGQPSAFKGKQHTPEALAKISENGNRRGIQCIETGKVYTSILAASEEMGIAKSHLRLCVLSGKPAKGLTFKLI